MTIHATATSVDRSLSIVALVEEWGRADAALIAEA